MCLQEGFLPGGPCTGRLAQKFVALPFLVVILVNKC